MTAGSNATNAHATGTLVPASSTPAALHAVWANGSLWLWGEAAIGSSEFTGTELVTQTATDSDAPTHPFALSVDDLRAVLAARAGTVRERAAWELEGWSSVGLRVRLPAERVDADAPTPSPAASPKSAPAAGDDEPDSGDSGSADRDALVGDWAPLPSPTLALVRRISAGVAPTRHDADEGTGQSPAGAGRLFGLDGESGLDAGFGSEFGLDADDLDDLSLDEAAFTAGRDDDESDAPDASAATATDSVPGMFRLGVFVVPALEIPASIAPDVLWSLVNEPESNTWGDARRGSGSNVVAGDSVRFFAVCDRFARYLVAQQRVAPMVSQDGMGQLSGQWLPWLSDSDASERVRRLAASVPGSARAADDDAVRDPWTVVEQALDLLVEAHCRAALVRETMDDTVEGRDTSDPHVAWLRGLLGERRDVPASPSACAELAGGVRTWVGALEDRGVTTGWRLLLRVNEPLTKPEDGVEPEWSLSFHLQSTEDDLFIVDAVDVWLLTRDTVVLEGKRLERPQELLLAELGRASRVYTRLERALGEHEPIELMLKTKEAYEFLREVRPLLEEQGMTVQTPSWWDTPSARLGARLRIEGAGEDPFAEGAGTGAGASSAQLGLEMLVRYQWEIAVGDTTISLNQFERLAESQTPLVQIGGRWVEVRPEDLKAAVEFIRENPGGEMKIGEAVRLAFGTDAKETGVRITGLEAEGWLGTFFAGFDAMANDKLPLITPPETFAGTLRPYQLRGVSWLAFMERFGFGACLADDMGLGKTIQLLALLLHERELHARHLTAQAANTPAVPADDSVPNASADGGTAETGAALPARLRPTLLVVPTSVVGNWIHESKRFGVSMKAMVHHGAERLSGDEFVDEVLTQDLVVTTYSLAHRDRDMLQRVPWQRVVLDEAQYIKNPQAKQSQAVRSIQSDSRVVLTGTPVENRLSELWSIVDFLNPGYLGTAGGFRKRFGLPIERYRDPHRLAQLRSLVRPFILRRLKTDPTVVTDLPSKVETREFAHLTSEQARLYEQCVKQMLGEVEQTEGIRRRGLVLSALVRLKQICNHPSQLLKDFNNGVVPDPARSGKCVRLMEILDALLAEGDQCLIFTQFRQMGVILQAIIEHEFKKPVLFIHGGTPRGQREKMVQQFQKADGTRPVMLLSLKAGGVGLNLTAATHVIHFDRWWNPAVENQATDRAHRIGQTRSVMVHKFIVRGTLEERIDEMIESKLELAEHIIGAGESMLSDLDSDSLRNILQLRSEAIGDD